MKLRIKGSLGSRLEITIINLVSNDHVVKGGLKKKPKLASLIGGI